MKRQVQNKRVDEDKYLHLLPQLRESTSLGVCYRCLCSKGFGYHKHRLMIHIQKCATAKETYQRRKLLTQQIETAQNTSNNSNLTHQEYDRQVISDLQRQINQLNAKVFAMKPEEMESLKTSDLAKTYAHLFWKQTSLIFQNHIEAGFHQIFKEVLLKKQVPTEYFPSIRLKLAAFMNSLNFSSLVDDYPIQLSKAHKLLMEGKEKSLKGDRAIQPYIRGYHFWNRFQNLRDYGKIIQKIGELKPRAKEQICRYYKQIIKLTSYPFPNIPVKFFTHKQLINSEKRKKISIENVRLLVSNLLNKGLHTLAVDFWFCVCMGLRKRQMLRVKIQNQQGEFYDALNLVEQKNKHYCLRPIPQSLKRLVSRYKTEYPFTEKRIETMQQISAKLNRRFYGYRSACITELISAFSATSFKTHHATSITNRYYLNKNSYGFVDSFFKLDVVQNDPNIAHSNILLQQNQQLDFIEVSIHQDELAVNLKQLIEQMDLDEQEEQQIMISGIDVMMKKDDPQFEQLRLISQIFKDYGIQMETSTFSSIKQAFKFSIQDRHFDVIYSNYFHSIPSNSLTLAVFLEEVYQINSLWIRLQDGQLQGYPNHISTEIVGTIIVLEVSQEGEIHWKVSDHQLKYCKTKKRSSLMTVNNMRIDEEWEFIKKMPSCIYCSKSLTYTECSQHLYFSCPSHSLKHKCLTISQSLQTRNFSLYFQSLSSFFIHPKFQQATFQRQRNNIAEILDKTFRTSIHQYKYYSTLPTIKIKTNISVVDAQTKQKVIQNRVKQQYLPLKIADIFGKGYGVLATKDISANTLICSYLGAIGTNENLLNGQDSQFNCGFVVSKQGVQQIIIIARQYANVGRFLNAPGDGCQANCRAEFMLLPQGQENCSLTVVYISKRSISINEELTVKYSQLFWQFVASGQQMLQSSSPFTLSINQVYSEYHLQYKQFVLKKALLNRAAIGKESWSIDPNKCNGISNIYEPEQIMLEDQQLQRLVPDNIEIEIKLFFEPTDSSSDLNFVGSYQHSSHLRNKYQSYSSVEQFQLIYPRIINIEGDGQCLFRSIAYSYFVLYFQQACQFFFTNLQPLSIFSQSLNTNLRLVEKYLISWFQKARRKNPKAWCLHLKRFWNKSFGLDKFCCELLRKRCVSQFSTNLNFYKDFWSVEEIEEVTKFLKKPKHNARDAVPYALSNILSVQLNIWILFEADTQAHLIGQKHRKRLDICLINEHYLISIRQIDVKSAFHFFQLNSTPQSLLNCILPIYNIKKKKKQTIKTIKIEDIDYNPIETVPTVYLSKAQWGGFQQFIIKAEQQYRQFGGIKIVLPFKMGNKNKLILALRRKRISRLVQTIIQINHHMFSYQNHQSEKSHIFEDFWNECCAEDKKVDPEVFQSPDIDQQFWFNFQKGNRSQSSPDNQIESCLLAEMKWATKQFESFFTSVVTEKLIGINTPYTFIGRKNSVFGWHKQDYNLGALNYQLLGFPKIWYVISSENASRFEQYCRSSLKGRKKLCQLPLNHKNLLINPYEINKQGIKVRKVIQKQNEIVVVFPRAYHSGFNYGHNINEAINYGTLNWLSDLASFENCRCGIIPTLDLDSLMKNLLSLQQEILNNPIVASFLKKQKTRYAEKTKRR